MLFEVNGTSENKVILIKGSYNFGSKIFDDTSQRTNLTATALTQYNNTEIQ